jgi:hypothetical protein
MRSNWLVISETPHDPLQQLTRLSHHKPQAVEVDEHLEQFRTLERFHGVGQLAALAKGDHEIVPGLAAARGDTVGSRHHRVASALTASFAVLMRGVYDR